jgi:phospholipid/cholesterol/gamma-HCH transport system permease protein
MNSVLSFFTSVGGITIFFLKVIISIFTSPIKKRHILQSMANIGVNTLPIASIMAIFTGMVLATQAYYQFKQFDVEMYIGTLVGFSMVRELGPVLTAIIVAGRIGSSTAAEIGSMKVTEQLDAMKILAVDPISYLSTPRFLASLVMLPTLTIYTDFIGIFGGYLIGVWKYGVRSGIYIDKMLQYITAWDVITGLIKSLFFGIIIIVVGCYKGFSAKGGAEGVGRATTGAVVVSSILILIANYFLTAILLS